MTDKEKLELTLKKELKNRNEEMGYGTIFIVLINILPPISTGKYFLYAYCCLCIVAHFIATSYIKRHKKNNPFLHFFQRGLSSLLVQSSFVISVTLMIYYLSSNKSFLIIIIYLLSNIICDTLYCHNAKKALEILDRTNTSVVRPYTREKKLGMMIQLISSVVTR